LEDEFVGQGDVVIVELSFAVDAEATQVLIRALADL
jgi:hypothetical protein